MKVKHLNIIIPTVAVLLIILRISFGFMLGNWFPSEQGCDDALLVGYASLKTHFLSPTPNSLLKYMGYPLLLDFCYVTKIPYSVVMSIMWVCCAILTYFVIKKIPIDSLKQNLKLNIARFFFVYVLFFPTAFELWMGTRLYRNAAIAPFSMLTFLLTILIIEIFLQHKNLIETIRERERERERASAKLVVYF